MTDLTEIRRFETYRSEFIAAVSHEMKTPLTGIIGAVDAINAGALDHPDYRTRCIETLSLQSERLHTLLQNFLSLTSLDALRKTGEENDFLPVRPLSVVRSAVEVCRPAAEAAGIEIAVGECVPIEIFADSLLLQQALNNRLAQRGEQKAVTVVTQVEVDKNDPGFSHPTKPIGAFFSADQRAELQQAHPDWRFVEDSGRGYRRVVASPEPKRIVEAEAIKTLTQQGFVVIGAGGGGIPVVRSPEGDYQSVDAVIDKDLSTALLAREIHADILVITTGVEKVCVNFGKPNQQALDTVGISEMSRYMQEGHFPAGSMLPKIVASLTFLQHGGKRVIITTPECLPAALRGATGTHIVHD